MKCGDTWVEVKGGDGKVGILWWDGKRIAHGKVVNSLREAVDLVDKMLKENKDLYNVSFYFNSFGWRLPTEQVENDPVLSALPSHKCFTLIRKNKE